jgi:adenine-specific DNA-methyltransferase
MLKELEEERVLQPERYFFSWAGRNDAIRARDSPPKGFLASCPEASIDFEKTRNIFVEGDNLEVLKIFQSSLRNRVKMIYIDPPYNANSGQQFYEDDFRDSLRNYLSTTKPERKPDKAHENLETSGRLHSRRLSMIYPRIFLAKNLLQDGGVMFVSIDDTEVHNLRMIMNEIFGEENVETMIWKKVDSNEGKLKLIKRFRIEHEYILVGYKNKERCFFKKVSELPRFKNPTENIDDDPRGDWISGNMSSTEAISVKEGKNYYQVTSPGGRKFSRQWKFPKAEFDRLNRDNRIYWGKNGNNVPRPKVFSNEPRLVYVSSVGGG